MKRIVSLVLGASLSLCALSSSAANLQTLFPAGVINTRCTIPAEGQPKDVFCNCFKGESTPRCKATKAYLKLPDGRCDNIGDIVTDIKAIGVTGACLVAQHAGAVTPDDHCIDQTNYFITNCPY